MIIADPQNAPISCGNPNKYFITNPKAIIWADTLPVQSNTTDIAKSV